MIYNTNLVGFVLSMFRNVEEVKEALEKITVADISLVRPTAKAPLHYIFSDAFGNHLIVEFIDGEERSMSNRTGVLTNEPPFDWHQINLQHYVHLSLYTIPKDQLGRRSIRQRPTGDSGRSLSRLAFYPLRLFQPQYVLSQKHPGGGGLAQQYCSR